MGFQSIAEYNPAGVLPDLTRKQRAAATAQRVVYATAPRLSDLKSPLDGPPGSSERGGGDGSSAVGSASSRGKVWPL